MGRRNGLGFNLKRMAKGLERVDKPVSQMVEGTYEGKSDPKSDRNKQIDDALKKAMG